MILFLHYYTNDVPTEERINPVMAGLLDSTIAYGLVHIGVEIAAIVV